MSTKEFIRTQRLKKDCQKLSNKYIKHREMIFGDIPLIPQLYWGNCINPDTIILGKNASYSVEDEIDNFHFRMDLLKNALSNEDNNRYFLSNLLVDTTKEFCMTSVSRYWRNAFSGWDDYECGCNKNSFMDNVAIINMYGFYSEELSEKPKEKSYLEEEPELLDMIRNHIKSGKTIYIMWKKSIKW